MNIILTGASGGVGKAIFAEIVKIPNAHIVLVGRNHEKLRELSRKHNYNSSNLQYLIADFDDISNLENVSQRCLSLLNNRVDIIINNAGIGYHCKVEEIVLSELISTFNVNVYAPIVMTSRILPYMKRSSNGKVINISSVLGEKAMPHTSVYTSSKHALNGFSKVLRKETSNMGISVTLIEPGAIDTPFIDNTYAKATREIFSKRQLKKLSPALIAQWVLKVIECENSVCPEVIRISPTQQVI